MQLLLCWLVEQLEESDIPFDENEDKVNQEYGQSLCPLPQKGNIVNSSTSESGKVDDCQVLLKWLFMEEQKMFSFSLLVVSVFIISQCQGQYLVLGTIYFLCAERNTEKYFHCSILLAQVQVMPRKIFLGQTESHMDLWFLYKGCKACLTLNLLRCV